MIIFIHYNTALATYTTEVADGSKRNYCLFRVVLPFDLCIIALNTNKDALTLQKIIHIE